jgi:hypothetical protein
LRGELVAFEKLYIKTVGALYAELDEIEAQIAELIAHQTPENEKTRAAADQARRKAEDSKSTVGELALDIRKNPKLLKRRGQSPAHRTSKIICFSAVAMVFRKHS